MEGGPISHHTSDPIDPDLLAAGDLGISLGDDARDRRPTTLSTAERRPWPLEDPARRAGLLPGLSPGRWLVQATSHFLIE